VGEALNETAFGNGLVARGKHYLMFGHQLVTNPTMKARERLLQSDIMFGGAIFLSGNVNVFEAGPGVRNFKVNLNYCLLEINN
jgi:lysosomal alpha-mannosidase